MLPSWGMPSPALPILSPSLSAKLAALATRPVTNRELDDILTELAALPAHLVVRASREIATRAGLGWWQPERRPRQVIPTHRASLFVQRIKDRLWPKSPPLPFPSDRELLAANADLAWLFLFHPSGYLRETALDHIITPPTSPFFLAALAWRLNDWVRLCARQPNNASSGFLVNSLRPLPQMRHRICSNAGSFGAGGVTRQIFSIWYLRVMTFLRL
jgi:hypothetical protein